MINEFTFSIFYKKDVSYCFFQGKGLSITMFLFHMWMCGLEVGHYKPPYIYG